MSYLAALEDFQPSMKIALPVPITSTITPDQQLTLDLTVSAAMAPSHPHLRHPVHITVTCQIAETSRLTIPARTNLLTISSDIPRIRIMDTHNNHITPADHLCVHTTPQCPRAAASLQCDFQQDHMMSTIVTVKQHPLEGLPPLSLAMSTSTLPQPTSTITQ